MIWQPSRLSFPRNRGELRFFPSPELMPNSMTASRDYNQIAALTSSA